MRAILPFVLAAVLAGTPTSALAGQTLQLVLKVSTDAEPGLTCQLQVAMDSTGVATGAQYDCQGPHPVHQFFTVEDFHKGVVLYHKDSPSVDVMTLYGPTLDGVHGGAVRLHYLSNYLGGQYADWNAEIDNVGGTWIAYTDRSAGHDAFNTVFAAKRTVLGRVVGISAIQPSWTH
jgi:hypothetical protein